MAIQMRRGAVSDLDTSKLKAGEFAVCSNGDVYVAYQDGRAKKLGDINDASLSAYLKSTDAQSTYLSKTDASNTYLSKTANDSAMQAKIGWCEVVGSTLYFYSDKAKTKQIGSVSLPSGSGTTTGITKAEADLLYSALNHNHNDLYYTKAQSDEKYALKGESGNIELVQFPNVTIIGTPTIQSGQISNFSKTNYCQFPFLVDFKGRPFEIKMCFTTGSDVVNQQNIIDSDFGLAFAVQNRKFVLAMSTDGATWNLGATTGAYTVLANTTYYVSISWTGTQYKSKVSTNGETYTDDITVTSSTTLYPKQIVIGVGDINGSTPKVFGGTINLNNCDLTISDKVVWQGMDDVGLATRLATDLSNLDDAGKAVIDGMISAVTDPINENLSELRQDFDNADFGSGNGMTTDQINAICDFIKRYVVVNADSADDANNIVESLRTTLLGDTDTENKPVSVAWSGTIATVNNLKNLTASYSGTVATIGA